MTAVRVEAYRNPVWPRSFPDPFVLAHRGEYWAYCTGFWSDGRCFGVLRSPDLVSWEPRAGALAPLPGDAPCYWAPEVAYHAGRFYLYYSVGNEERMEIRVAVAGHPGGPFADSGRGLTSEPFAIDAHVFTAADGTRWLFYATDFLDRSHIGTGTVRDRLLDPFTLAGDPRPVTLPRHDWHVYDPRRAAKGNVRWHTVEGPFVLERKGLLYQMFSGGNWQNPTYGVSYATARDVASGEEWVQAADGERVLPILRTLRGPEGNVVGPGHNSVVRGPDLRELFCVYHRWSDDASARVMCLDRLDWAGERMFILGPTVTPQPAPGPPTFADPAPASGTAGAVFASGPSFVCEVSARNAGAGLALRGPGGESVRRFLLEPSILDPTVDPTVFHTLRLDVDGHRAALSIDGAVRWRGRLPEPAAELLTVAEGAGAELSGFALTLGWEELFEEDGDLADRGWDLEGGTARIENGRLRLIPTEPFVQIARGPELSSYELAVNVRVEGKGAARIRPALAGGEGPEIVLERGEGGWGLDVTGAPESRMPLPDGFDPTVDQQLRFLKRGGEVEISWEGRPLGRVAAPEGPARIGLGASGDGVSFERVRLTAVTAARSCPGASRRTRS
jgi:GH43 family beta-xylosidase